MKFQYTSIWARRCGTLISQLTGPNQPMLLPLPKTVMRPIKLDRFNKPTPSTAPTCRLASPQGLTIRANPYCSAGLLISEKPRFCLRAGLGGVLAPSSQQIFRLGSPRPPPASSTFVRWAIPTKTQHCAGISTQSHNGLVAGQVSTGLRG